MDISEKHTKYNKIMNFKLKNIPIIIIIDIVVLGLSFFLYVYIQILPMRISLSWLSMVLNPITSQKLMPEVITILANQINLFNNCIR